MRSTDERIAAVQRRSKRLRRHRNGRFLAILVFLMALPLVDLVGRHAAGSLSVPSLADTGLLGATSLFGPSVGGYVLVAVIAAIVAAVAVALVMARRKQKPEGDNDADSAETSNRKEL